MVWADIAILVIIALSAIISIMRGFVREALSLAAWIVAFWVAFTFSENLAGAFADYIDTPSMRMVAAFTVLFVITLLVAALINFFIVKLVEKTGLSGTDRMLGVVFGVLRGGIIVAILVLLAGLTPLPQDPWWHESMFIKHFQEVAIWVRDRLPPEYAENIVYE